MDKFFRILFWFVCFSVSWEPIGNKAIGIETRGLYVLLLLAAVYQLIKEIDRTFKFDKTKRNEEQHHALLTDIQNLKHEVNKNLLEVKHEIMRAFRDVKTKL